MTGRVSLGRTSASECRPHQRPCGKNSLAEPGAGTALFGGMKESRHESRVVRGPRDDPGLTEGQLVRSRVAWFEFYSSQPSVFAGPGAAPYTCPCCGHATLAGRGSYEICGECGWEDDGQDDYDSAVVRGGPNGPLSLDAARAQYEARGRVRGIHRPPKPPQ